MKKGKKRARTLSLEGLDLFNIGIKAPPLTPTPPTLKKTCLRKRKEIERIRYSTEQGLGGSSIHKAPGT